jgi:hypothetical protein
VVGVADDEDHQVDRSVYVGIGHVFLSSSSLL